MKIKILGTSGVKSQQLERIIRGVVKELGIDAEIEEVKDFNNIMEYPILTIPGLVIDEKLVCSGRVPTRAEVNRFVTTELKRE